MDSSYEPDIYDFTTPAAVLGDLEWYRRKAQESGGPILELGAGTGRVAIVLARDGARVHALDAHPGMLAVGARRFSSSARYRTPAHRTGEGPDAYTRATPYVPPPVGK